MSIYAVSKIEPFKFTSQGRTREYKYAVVDGHGNELSYHQAPSEAREAIKRREHEGDRS